MPPLRQNQIFISYNYKDQRWRDEIEIQLKPYLRDGSIISWSDKQISPGSQWFSEIKTALTNTKVPVLLVTPDFLASDFIHEHELGPLLKQAERDGVEILWVPVRDSAYKQNPLKNYQAVFDPAKPLAGMMGSQHGMGQVFSMAIPMQALDLIMASILWITLLAATTDLLFVWAARATARWVPGPLAQQKT